MLRPHACASGLLLVLCALIAGAWLVSYRRFTVVQAPVSAGADRWELVSCRGLMAVCSTQGYPLSNPPRFSSRRISAEQAHQWDDLYWAGSYGGMGAQDGRITIDLPDGAEVSRPWYVLVVPDWLLVLLAAATPALQAALALRARGRRRRGRCECCGHLATGGICPACTARAAIIGVTPRTRVVAPV